MPDESIYIPYSSLLLRTGGVCLVYSSKFWNTKARWSARAFVLVSAAYLAGVEQRDVEG